MDFCWAVSYPSVSSKLVYIQYIQYWRFYTHTHTRWPVDKVGAVPSPRLPLKASLKIIFAALPATPPLRRDCGVEAMLWCVHWSDHPPGPCYMESGSRHASTTPPRPGLTQRCARLYDSRCSQATVLERLLDKHIYPAVDCIPSVRHYSSLSAAGTQH